MDKDEIVDIPVALRAEQSSFNELKKEMESLYKDIDKMSNTGRKNKALEMWFGPLAKVESSIGSILKQVSDLENYRVDLDLNKSEASIERFKNEIENVKENIKITDEEIASAEEKIVRHEERIVEINKQIKSEKDKYSQKVNEIATSEKENQSVLLQAAHKEYEKKVSELNLSRQIQRESIASAKERLGVLNSEKSTYINILADTKEALEAERLRSKELSEINAGGEKAMSYMRQNEEKEKDLLNSVRSRKQQLTEILEITKNIVNAEKLAKEAEKQRLEADKEKKKLLKGQIQDLREQIKIVQNSASQFYYMLRSMKMLTHNVQKLNTTLGKWGKSLITMSKIGIRAILRLASGFLLFRKSADKSKKSTEGFTKSLKSSLKTVLKYTFGIRSLYVLFNRLRGAIKDGLGNMAMQFDEVNDSMSSLITSMSLMKNSLATIAQPIVAVLAPALEKLSARFNELSISVASFFATLTGQEMIYKAVRVQEDYAESLDKTAKSAEKAAKELGHYDKLNVITKDKNDEGENSAFNLVPVETKFNELANKVKDFLSDLFSPLKKAWDREGEFVINAWKYALGEIKQLVADIGSDFMKVWKQEATVKIFQDILHIIGDIGLIVGNLAHNFDEAWNKNKVGFKILEKIRDIIGIIVNGIKRAADNTVSWSKHLKFTPLLESISDLLDSVKTKTQTIVDLLVYFWGNSEEHYGVILPFMKYMVEKGLPLLNQAIKDILDNIDDAKLSDNMKKLMDAFEPFLEKVWKALVIVLKDLGIAVGDFVNSDEFSSFVDLLVEWMNDADPETMAKGIETFIKAFITIKGITGVGSKALPVLTGIMTVMNAYKQFGLTTAVKKLNPQIATLTTEMSKIGTAGAEAEAGASAASTGAMTAGTLFAGLTALIGGSVVAIINFTKQWKEGYNTINEIFMLLGITIAAVGAVILGAPALIAGAIAAIIAAVATLFIQVHDRMVKFKEDFATAMHNFWKQLDLDILPKIENIGHNLGVAAGELLKKVINWFLNMPAVIWKFIDDSGGLANLGINILKGIFEIFLSLTTRLPAFLWKALWALLKGFKDGLCEAFGIKSPAKEMNPYGEYIIKGILVGITNVIKNIGKWIYDNIVKPMNDGLKEKFGIEGGVSSVFSTIGGNLMAGLKKGLEDKWDKIKGGVEKLWQKITDSAHTAYDEHSPSKQFQTIGSNLFQGMYIGMDEALNQLQHKLTATFLRIPQLMNATINPESLEQTGADYIGGLDKGMTTGLKLTFDNLVYALKQIGPAVSNAMPIQSFNKVGLDASTGLSRGLQSGFNANLPNILNLVNTIGVSIQSSMVKSMNSASASISSSMKQILAVFVSATPTISKSANSMGLSVFTSLNTGMSMSLKSVNVQMQNMFKEVIRLGESILNTRAMNSSGINTMKGLSDGMKHGASYVQNTTNSISRYTLDTFSNNLRPDYMNKIGRNLIGGLSNGLMDRLRDVLTSVRDICNRIAEEAREAFDIHSPSKVFMEIGQYLTEGLSVGIEEDAGDVEDSFEELVPGIRFLDKFCDGFTSRLSDLRQDSVSIVSSMMNDIDNLIAKVDALDSLGSISEKLQSVSNIDIPDITLGKVISPKMEMMVNSEPTDNRKVETLLTAILDALESKGDDIPDVVLKLNSGTLAKAVWDEQDKRYKQMGYSYGV